MAHQHHDVLAAPPLPLSNILIYKADFVKFLHQTITIERPAGAMVARQIPVLIWDILKVTCSNQVWVIRNFFLACHRSYSHPGEHNLTCPLFFGLSLLGLGESHEYTRLGRSAGSACWVGPSTPMGSNFLTPRRMHRLYDSTDATTIIVFLSIGSANDVCLIISPKHWSGSTRGRRQINF